MSGANIVHFEDNREWREIVRDVVGRSSHLLVAQSNELQGSLVVLDLLAAGELEADTVILGDNLSELPLFGRATSDDPLRIMEAIHERGLKVKTIGLGGLAMVEYGVEVDFDLTKAQGHLLGETLDLLHAIVPHE